MPTHDWANEANIIFAWIHDDITKLNSDLLKLKKVITDNDEIPETESQFIVLIDKLIEDLNNFVDNFQGV